MPNIITPEAILSYPYLFNPDTRGDEPKYSASFVFEKDTDISELQQKVLRVARQEWSEDLDDATIQYLGAPHPFPYLVSGDLRIRLPWRDDEGDVADKGYPEGSTFITARSSNPVGILSTHPVEEGSNTPAQILNARGDIRLADGPVIPQYQEVYAGARCRALLSVYAYKQPNTGVTFGLNGVQIVGDGERLDGRVDAADVFEADEDVAGDLSDLTGDSGESQPAGATQGGGDDLSDLIG